MSGHDQLVMCLSELTRLLWKLLLPLVLLTVVLVAVLVLMVVGLRLWFQSNRNARRARDGRPTVAFFHPYCNAGGGGERVLWCAIRALQNRYPEVNIVVYTGDQDVTAAQILDGARRRFDVALPGPVEFVFLAHRVLVEPGLFPHFTLLGQGVGSVFLGCDALAQCTPDLFVDSMGYAFTLPLFRYLGGCSVASYVHYPTVSTDMLSVVSERNPRFNNADYVSNNLFLSAAKLVYYCLFAVLYGAAGSCSHLVMVNSSWTLDHILALWRARDRTCVVYPPCAVEQFLDIPLLDDEGVETEAAGSADGKRRYTVVSVGQFRPEKDHRLQIRAFKKLADRRAGLEAEESLRLVLVGGCRHQEDRDRVLMLRGLCQELGIGDRVEFRLNVTFAELKRELAGATIGLHTMWNEHFGIGVVECMAAGAVVLAHKSGGPRRDIVVPLDGGVTGFLAEDEDGFADAMDRILRLAPEERAQVRRRARQSVARFSDREFEACFLAAMEPLMNTLER
ncbi:hypothetical protein NHX12_014674 [Muraenolepis orangiensis]|uniref:GDP-Man:Man(3)GlcNAc(2)-PP-Dol alpha-1,2-mannosyltransferase n=1 Tax=Muraenolepis orangiensis TaxID=630683 RepID=A0A9Q0DAT0_9TELE|nr:hypothetical protein NHX12_014674 [Muraenolepis orangiensis]